MKHSLALRGAAGLVGLLLVAGWSWGKKEETVVADAKSTTQARPAASTPAAASVAPGAMKDGKENIVHTFANDDEVKTFANEWQQRQGIITRMAVLRAYWSEEQSRLGEMDKQLSSTYKIDLKKRHVLSPERKVLLEMEPLPEAQNTDVPPAPSTGS